MQVVPDASQQYVVFEWRILAEVPSIAHIDKRNYQSRNVSPAGLIRRRRQPTSAAISHRRRDSAAISGVQLQPARPPRPRAQQRRRAKPKGITSSAARALGAAHRPLQPQGTAAPRKRLVARGWGVPRAGNLKRVQACPARAQWRVQQRAQRRVQQAGRSSRAGMAQTQGLAARPRKPGDGQRKLSGRRPAGRLPRSGSSLP